MAYNSVDFYCLVSEQLITQESSLQHVSAPCVVWPTFPREWAEVEPWSSRGSSGVPIVASLRDSHYKVGTTRQLRGPSLYSLIRCGL